MTLITFDFHNTIAHCDPWFELEIRTLPARVAETLAPGLDPDRVTTAYQVLRQEVKRTGIEVDAYTGVEAVLRGLGAIVSRDDIDVTVDRLMRQALAHAHAVPGVLAVIDGLVANGFRLGVVSSAVHHDFLEWTLDHIGVMSSFAFVLSSARAGYYKSHPEIYRQALRLGETDARDAVHIGDSLRWDVAGAAAVGLRTVWLDHRDSNDAPDVLPTLTITTFDGALSSILDIAASVRP